MTSATGPERTAQRSAGVAVPAQPADVSTAVSATVQLAQVLHQLADEATGPLATVRGLVEHAAHRLGALPHAYGPESGHQLELLARRLYGIQHDLHTTAVALSAHARPTVFPAWATAVPQANAAHASR
ncbi:hypothetical protein [Streptomyces sp. NPDC003077]|uniref:hypothetical protein n=1 Tax=Streptomyces sp. NPDC003077 TaxID=3154443 RepID=UPI0033B0AF12